MGDGVGFNIGCYVNGFGGLVIGDEAMFGPYSMVHTANHHYDDRSRPVDRAGLARSSRSRSARERWIGMGALHPPGRHDRRGRDRRRRRASSRRTSSRTRSRQGTRPASSKSAQRSARPLPAAAALREGDEASRRPAPRRCPDLELGFAYQGKTLTEWYGTGDELFDRWWDLGDDARTALPAVLAEYEPDLIHSHNLPDTLTVLANELVAGRDPGRPRRPRPPEPALDAVRERLRAAARLADARAAGDRGERRGRHGLGRAPRRAPRPLPAPGARRWSSRTTRCGATSRGCSRSPSTETATRRSSSTRERCRRTAATTTCGRSSEQSSREGVSLDVYPSRPVPEYDELAERRTA